MKYRVVVGDVTDTNVLLEASNGAQFDAILCDPPYGLSFMGREWDHGVPSAEVWDNLMVLCKPGAMLMAFGGSRTFHRLVCAVEDASWEIRDVVMWLYGTGFPKNHNLNKAGASDEWAGHGTALKPAYEPIVVAQAPRDGSFTNNVTEHGCGALWIDGCRIESETIVRSRNVSFGSTGAAYSGGDGQYRVVTNDKGRWPANVILDERAAELLDQQTGTLRNGGQNATSAVDVEREVFGRGRQKGAARPGDSGGASRFFYCAKASRKEREAGLDGFGTTNVNDGRKTSIDNAYQRGDTKRRNTHPTVKPLDLCRYLATLLLPPPHPDGKPRRILVPFSGSGSEMIGCLLAGWDEVVGIEQSEEYADIARARLAHWHEVEFGTDEQEVTQNDSDGAEGAEQLDLLEDE